MNEWSIRIILLRNTSILRITSLSTSCVANWCGLHEFDKMVTITVVMMMMMMMMMVMMTIIMMVMMMMMMSMSIVMTMVMMMVMMMLILRCKSAICRPLCYYKVNCLSDRKPALNYWESMASLKILKMSQPTCLGIARLQQRFSQWSRLQTVQMKKHGLCY